jgi:hypothetical protein
MTTESEKWFYSGPIDEISKLDYLNMNSHHRQLYNLYLQIEQKKAELETLEKSWFKRSAQLMKLLKEDPEHPAHDWAWIESNERNWPKWKEEFVRECGQKKANEISAKYKKKKLPYLRIKFIHPRPPE